MTSIKKTGPSTLPTPRRNVSSCGPATPTERAASSCGGWVSKATRSKTESAQTTQAPKVKPGSVSSCGGGGWSRYGKIPSSC